MEIKDIDELIENLLKEKSITVLKIQKVLGIGYSLAVSILDALEQNGLVLSASKKEKVAKKGKLDEVAELIKELIEQAEEERMGLLLDYINEDGEFDCDKADELLKPALKLFIQKQKVSIATLQRAFKIGYSRAARLVDFMEELDFISDSTTIPRIVFITKEAYIELFGSWDD